MKIKAVLTIIGLLGSLSVMAKMDTIPVSRNYKTILVLPAPYDFSINGKELNFLESFPTKNASATSERIVLLIYNDVAPDTSDFTNYTIYTRDGRAYDFILQLVDIPAKKRWTITTDMVDNLEELSHKKSATELDESDFASHPDIKDTLATTKTVGEKLEIKPEKEIDGEPLPLTKEL